MELKKSKLFTPAPESHSLVIDFISKFPTTIVQFEYILRSLSIEVPLDVPKPSDVPEHSKYFLFQKEICSYRLAISQIPHVDLRFVMPIGKHLKVSSTYLERQSPCHNRNAPKGFFYLS